MSKDRNEGRLRRRLMTATPVDGHVNRVAFKVVYVSKVIGQRVVVGLLTRAKDSSAPNTSKNSWDPPRGVGRAPIHPELRFSLTPNRYPLVLRSHLVDHLDMFRMYRRHHLIGNDPSGKEIDHRQKIPPNSSHQELAPVASPHQVSTPYLVAGLFPRRRPPFIGFYSPLLSQMPVDRRCRYTGCAYLTSSISRRSSSVI